MYILKACDVLGNVLLNEYICIDFIKRNMIIVTPEQKAAQLELYKGLGDRKKNLEKVLQEKIKELKDMCLKESEITGELPHEYSMFMAPGEKTPTIKKRIGTGFSIAGTNYI